MKKLFLTLLFFGLLPLVSEAAWYDTAWDYRIEIQSDSALVAANETDFQLFFDLSLMDSSFFDDVQSDGSDIIITAGDETTALDYELVSLDISGNTGELHFKADNINSAADSSYYIYYGNSGTNSFVSGNIWNDFKGVWHFDEDLNIVNPTGLGVVTQAAMDGSDGSWALWYGENAISTVLRVVTDEDQISDTERAHTTEQLGYWVFEPGMINILDKDGVIIGEVGSIDTSAANSSSVSLVNNYTNPVVVTSAQYDSGVPAVVRTENISSNDFDVFMQNPTPSSSAGTPDSAVVYYIVIEEGNYLLPGNIPLEAGTENIVGINNSGNWNNNQMIQLTPVQSYVNPVVLGSVATNNNSQWQTFWSSNGTTTSPASASNIYIGRHTGAETSPTVVDESVSYIVLEQHANTNNGYESKAQLGTDIVAGFDNAPPYQYPGLSTALSTDIFSDSTVNAFHADYEGGITSAVSSQIGRAVDLSGTGSKLPISGLNYSNNNSLDEITASMWLQTTDTARSGIFDFDRSEYWELGLNFHNAGGDSGKISFDTASSSDGIKDLNSSISINDGGWHHIVAVFDKNNPTDKKIYIDGQLDSAVDQHSASLGTGVTRYGFIGDGSEAGSVNGSANNLPFEGVVDETRLLHSAVDADWVTTVFNNQNDNDAFWNILAPEQNNVAPEKPTLLFFNHTDAQSGLSNPQNIEIDGVSSYVPYFSAIYNGDGDTATKAYIQVSTDVSFSTIDYWDSGWFDIPSAVSDDSRSIDIEYGDLSLTGVNAPIANLAMDDGAVTYYWRIAFEDNSSLQGPFSDSALFTLLDITSSPQNISATKIEASPDTFIINWQDVSLSETYFEVEYREDTGGGFGSWQIVTLPATSPTPANTTSWGMENTVDNAAYNFRVRSCNYAGCSVWTEDALTHFTDPEAPVNVCSAYVSDSQFDITWKNRAVFDQSSTEQCDGLTNCNAATFTGIAISVVEPGPVTSVGAVTNEIYRWSTFADNGIVTSQPTYSNFEYTSPAATSMAEATRVSDSIINLEWVDNSLYEDGFRVFVSVDGASFTEVTAGVNTTSANTLFYSYTQASLGHSYQFDVRAHISQTVCGVVTNNELLSSSALSNIVSTTPVVPLITTTTYTSDNDISVFWLDQSSQESGFNIYVRIDNGSWSPDGSVAANVTNYNYIAGSANHVYDFYIESFTNISLPGNPDLLSNTEGPAVFRRIYTAPSEPVLADILVSSTSIDWSVTDTADYELGFTLYDFNDDSLVQSISSPNITNVTETGLTPNTLYERYIRSYVENSGTRLESIDSNSVQFYTLANSPTEPTITETTEGVIDVTWLSGGNPAGTEYYIENSITGINSGWAADLFSWNETGLSCGSNYRYYLKARNGNNIETGEELLELETVACPESNTGSVIRYVCKDESALNYSAFGRHKSSLCEYGDTYIILDTEENDNDNFDEIILGEGGQCSTSSLLTQNMKSGDKNGRYSSWQKESINEVKILQRHMNRLGFASGPEDGILGPITDGAIKRMQAYLGTFADGYVGPITRRLINESCDSNGLEKIIKINNDVCTFNKNARKGDEGSYIFTIQNFLKKEGFLDVLPNGYFGLNTSRAVIDFQTEYPGIYKNANLSSPTSYFYKYSRAKATELCSQE